VKNFQHIHVWAISTTQNAITANLIVSKELSNIEIVALKNKVKHQLEHLNIHHATIETDFECKEKC
jgi:cobalt-zinc-cadmium efflux system protein